MSLARVRKAWGEGGHEEKRVMHKPQVIQTFSLKQSSFRCLPERLFLGAPPPFEAQADLRRNGEERLGDERQSSLLAAGLRD